MAKNIFSRTEILLLRIKISDAIEKIKMYPIKEDSKEAGMVYALKATLIALQNLDRE